MSFNAWNVNVLTETRTGAGEQQTAYANCIHVYTLSVPLILAVHSQVLMIVCLSFL